ncbi:MAG: peptide chain release factor N(5)-glutamine methyltransferase [Labrys sp. (in: a-proteobacteria)]
MRTLRSLLTETRARLAAAGIATPDLDARLLAAEALGVTSLVLATEPERMVNDADAARLADSVARRLAGEPVDRILGHREFWGLCLALGPATLAPRPDTETLVEAALAAFAGRPSPRRLLDLGVGTGALLLALLREWPEATGLGVDVAPEAVAVARANAEANGLAGRADIRVGDWGSGIMEHFDLIVSNPPYIPSGDIASLDREVRLHDPLLALDGGTDGLVAYRAILADARRLLAPDGILVLELGQGQEEAVATLAGLAGCAVLGPAQCDLGGVPRALVLRSATSGAGRSTVG